MKSLSIAIAICIALAVLFAAPASADPKYIYGMHDLYGGEDMEGVSPQVRGWHMFVPYLTIGHDPDDYTGGYDFSNFANSGYTVICRLDNSPFRNGDGTLPLKKYYRGFAQRCANYVRNSPGCHIWQIGNEPNLEDEWPTGEPITVANYVECYNLCYDAIKALPGHAGDIVCPAAVATWCPPYDGSYDGSDPPVQQPNYGIEQFDEYFVNMLNGIGSTKVNGIILHAYTHGTDPLFIEDTDVCTDVYPTWVWYSDIYFHFKVYQEYMERIPPAMNTVPVYITETDQNDSWDDTNSGWVKNAYAEINEWNNTAGKQKIRCLALFRWEHAGEEDKFYICDRSNVRQDWRDAMVANGGSGYTWATADTPDDAGRGVDTGNTFATALVIEPKTPDSTGAAEKYTGTLYVPTTDTDDYYKFWVTKGQTITVSMTSPSGSNFYLRLYNASGTTTDNVVTTAQTKLINRLATASGYWAMRVQRNTGSGAYTFSDTVNRLTTTTPTGTDYSSSTNTNVWVDTETSGYEAANVRDGNTATYWMSTGDSSSHFVQLTLKDPTMSYLRTRPMKGFIIKLASAAGLSSTLNLKRFTIWCDHPITGSGTQFVVDNSVQSGTIACSFPWPKPMRSVRLNITDCGADNIARVAEIQIIGDGDPITSATPSGTNKAIYFSTNASASTYTSPYDPYKAFDSVYTNSTSKWMSQASTSNPHWLWMYLGAPRKVTGYVVYHAGAAGESTSYNLSSFTIDEGITNATECTVDNSTRANTSMCKYTTPRELTIARMYIPTYASSDNIARVPEFQIFSDAQNYSESFEATPTWTTTYSSGTAATWSRVATSPYDGSYCLQASRSTGTTGGTSIRVKRYTVTANTYVTVRVYMKCPLYTTGAYLVETAVKAGNFSATDYSTNPTTWQIIKRFSESGTNGTADAWMQYQTTVYTGTETYLSVAFKHAGFGCAGPTAFWDLMRIN